MAGRISRQSDCSDTHTECIIAAAVFRADPAHANSWRFERVQKCVVHECGLQRSAGSCVRKPVLTHRLLSLNKTLTRFLVRGATHSCLSKLQLKRQVGYRQSCNRGIRIDLDHSGNLFLRGKISFVPFMKQAQRSRSNPRSRARQKNNVAREEP